MSVTELTSTLSPGRYEDLTNSLPTRDDLRVGGVDLEEPQCVRRTIDHSAAPSARPGTVVNPMRNTCSQISRAGSGQDLVPVSGSREFVTPVGDSPVVPVKVETSPRELTRSQGDFSEFTAKCGSSRVVGKRAIIPPGPLALPDTVDLVNLDEDIKDVEIPELMWASLWNMNTLFFFRNSTVWLSPSLAWSTVATFCEGNDAGIVAGVGCRRSQTSQSSGGIKPERLLRMRWLLVRKYTEGDDRKAKSAFGHFGISTPRTHKSCRQQPQHNK